MIIMPFSEDRYNMKSLKQIAQLYGTIMIQ